MKIFATRKKRKSTSSSATTTTTTKRLINKSDPIVEELLKKDSSEWNAKERRMIKRYRDRNVKESSVEGTDRPMIVEEKKEKEEGGTTSEENKEERGEDIKEQEMKTDNGEKNDVEYDSNSDAGDESDHNDEDNDSGNDSGNGNTIDDDESEVSIEKGEQKNNDETHELPKVEDTSLLENDVENIKIDADVTMGKGNDDNENNNDRKVNTDHEIWSLLDKLNSKQKRTYSRKLNRMGQSVLDEVEKEVKKILDDTIQENLKRDQTEATGTDNINSNTGVSTENQTENSTDSLQPKKKKQKKGADWSSLPADERLRREEQRTKQQEAAERRARGEANIAPGHKRPLNSERRRANRRKPKWVNKSPVGVKQEHNSSGFGHRKLVQQEQQSADNY